ncbi:hypothetical protein ACFP81_04200 [Deinococcus lacus]|uniref:Uncharacterized protein n=1 Tax=Deinococcus lacus TaxID=392561 RepID=A0ABW1YAJ9_9DEIO
MRLPPLPTGERSFLTLLLGGPLTLLGLGGLTAGLFYRARRPALWHPAGLAAGLRAERPWPTRGLEARWQPAYRPDWPELSVSVVPGGALLENQAREPLYLAGWSPAELNAWYPLRSRKLLPGGQIHLPLSSPAQAAHSRGVQVWYAATPPGPGTRYRTLRAEWQLGRGKTLH